MYQFMVNSTSQPHLGYCRMPLAVMGKQLATELPGSSVPQGWDVLQLALSHLGDGNCKGFYKLSGGCQAAGRSDVCGVPVSGGGVLIAQPQDSTRRQVILPGCLLVVSCLPIIVIKRVRLVIQTGYC